ncbi:hypothetical protein CG747_22110 [Streptomyces sp. CB02959]|nr:hypothetical protein CG747_22110 [Streptomyces sp. CB02959]
MVTRRLRTPAFQGDPGIPFLHGSAIVLAILHSGWGPARRLGHHGGTSRDRLGTSIWCVTRGLAQRVLV